MQLYSTSLVRSGSCAGAVYGNFSGGNKAHEIVVNHGTWLELFRLDSFGVAQALGTSEMFALVRSVVAFRTAGSKRDLLAVGTDSGCLTVLEFSTKEQRFKCVKSETFGKTGIKRSVPGQYLAADPAGRCVMVAAVEKQKLAFNIGRDTAERLIIASPLEAHKQRTVVVDLKGLSVGLDNPLFAAIEFDYTVKGAPRSVVLYEVEEGLNHVVRKASTQVQQTANMIIPIPGGTDGPGGMFICSESMIEYLTPGQDTTQHPPLRCRIPARVDLPPQRGILISSATVSYRKTKEAVSLFAILQSEYGDLYKLDIHFDQEKEAAELTGFTVKYFDTCPVARTLCVTKRGFLFLGSEFGDHRVYKFQQVGGEDDKTSMAIAATAGSETPAPSFAPRANRNISLCEGGRIESLAPATSMQIADVAGEDRNQIIMACGRGSRSSVRILRHGLKVLEDAASDLPGVPSAVWTAKSETDITADKYIVLSFANMTLVLAVEGMAIEQANESGLKTDVPTLSMSTLADGSIAQVYPSGLHRTGGKEGWSTTGTKVDCAASNERQVALALEGGRLVYFEMVDESGTLQRREHNVGEDIKTMALGAVPQGRKRSPFLVIGTFSNAVQILSLDPEGTFKQLSMQALPDQPSSIALIEMKIGEAAVLNLCVGLRNGVLVRSRLDDISGQITDSRSTFLGAQPVQCSSVTIPLDDFSSNEATASPLVQNALLALSSRPWLSFTTQGHAKTVPLSYDALTSAASFVNPEFDGVVAVSGRSLRIFGLENLNQMFNSKVFKLSMTPRHLLVHDKLIVVVEGDHNVPAAEKRQELWAQLKAEHAKQYPEEAAAAAAAEQAQGAEEEEDEDERPKLCVEEVGLPKCGSGNEGRWASQIRVLDPNSGTFSVLELGPNEFGVSACMAPLGETGEEFLVVGTVTELVLHPQSFQSAAIKVFRLVQGNLSLVHTTPVEGGMPRAICPIHRLLAVGIGSTVRILALGQAKMLIKAELKNLPTSVAFLRANGNRLYAGDVHESIHMLKFSPSDLGLSLFADDSIPRLCVTGEVLDYDTIAGSDKFGNVFVLRLPSDIGDADVDIVSGDRVLWDQARGSGAPNKFDQVVQYFTGEVITSMQKTALVPGKAVALVYCTVMGSVGALIPFPSKSDSDFFSLLQMHMRSEPCTTIVGRDHLSYRSYFAPVKGTVDGDLCKLFDSLPADRQAAIAEELDRTPLEVSRKIQDFEGCLL